ncbi:MGDG synthase family glycosyltransferase [Clostridium cylindrosporum]|uniref:Processive diacylglycerol beta-glucosyltransferase UgtP n=1 Tax=Clostridium cylindrosporum DSM 605 TaxID=1121307 RepID=A0A0J8D9S9_CLOCY|nr:glycosyltransferase [Clostridium cylindrosporum]KMT22815.1 processive diacylglycerol beta-glucosyltransferase UgtP [Clostridium cylindrosporum DSM 605]
MKILALTVSAGNGHNKAAESIKDYLTNNFEDIDVEIFDTLKYINPILDKLVVGSYLKSVKNTPALYGKLYEYAENDDTVSNLSGFVNDILSIKLKNLIFRKKPDVVYCTHPFPVEMLSILKRKHKVDIPVVAILTDYAPHSFWFYNSIDAYVIPHEDFVCEIREKGVPKDTIYPLGIPISNSFLQNVNKDKIRENLGLSKDKTTLLLMGGGLGIGNITKIYKELCFSTLDLQFIICAGNNTKLKNQLESLKARTLKKTIIFEYTEMVPELMSVSDILVSKPGGLTISEALVKNIPIIITSTIPGQEEKNADYLVNNGVAARVKESGDLTHLMYQLSQSKLRLSHMRDMAKEKSKPNSTKDIANLIVSFANKYIEK